MFRTKVRRLTREILERSEFRERPPVLLDIGASGFVHPKWRWIAPYSICLAFDADSRDVQHLEGGKGDFRQLHIFPAVVSPDEAETRRFYLTRSPHCSSALRPLGTALSEYAFADLFNVERDVELPAMTLARAIEMAGVEKVDWFKCDSQGTDLRLFKSLGEDIARRVLVADFEPGIIDAYENEDKLWKLMAFMDRQPFWMAAISIKGCPRANPELIGQQLGNRWGWVVSRSLPPAPGWAEVTYMNNLDASVTDFDKRDFLLTWVVATHENQHGFALKVASEGAGRFGDALFTRLTDVSKMLIRRRSWRLTLSLAKGGINALGRSLSTFRKRQP